MAPPVPDRIRVGKSLNMSRVLVGLWQVADIEKNGELMDPEKGAQELQAYADAGFDTFDMADHYGSAELIAGRLLARYRPGSDRPTVCTKWCPAPGPMTADIVRAGVEERLTRLGVDKVDLLQFHWWSFEHPTWLDALHELAALRKEGLIGEIGVTNFDAAHLHLALADGIPIVSNQVSYSLIDRRASGALTAVCDQWGVKLLAYGTVAGGFLSSRWVGQSEPAQVTDWSKMKYRRFIEAAGGWEALQAILLAADRIAQKHDVSLTNVATRWVLDQPAVAGVIIGARLGEANHSIENSRLFSFALDEQDRAELDTAFAATTPLPGDCGDEYRKPPFMTASGDLSHHLQSVPSHFAAQTVPDRNETTMVLTGSTWEDIAGYCRAKRVGQRVLVSGTTATAGADRAVAPADAAAQTTYILDKIVASLSAAGASVQDVVRTRIYVVDEDDALAVSRVHGRVFGDVKPANSMVVVSALIGDHRVEIEAEALVTD